MKKENTFVFTHQAKKQFLKLESKIQDLILEKLKYLKDVQTFEQNIKVVYHLLPATHRIKSGSYRLLINCDFENKKHRILKVGHRREIYK